MNKTFVKNNTKYPSKKPSNDFWICGKHPTLLAIKHKRRKIFEILVTKNSISALEKFLKENSLENLSSKIKIVDNQFITSQVGEENLHQGFAIKTTRLEVKTQNDLLSEIYDLSEKNQKLPTLVLLDQISDPHNVGAIIRSAASFGMKKIIFCDHFAPKENSTIVKSSAGTIDLVDMIFVTNFNNLIEKLKKNNYWIIGLDSNTSDKIEKIKEHKNIAIIIGSEGFGIRQLVKKNCDFLMKIPINHEVESLNASVAAAISFYEITK